MLDLHLQPLKYSLLLLETCSLFNLESKSDLSAIFFLKAFLFLLYFVGHWQTTLKKEVFWPYFKEKALLFSIKIWHDNLCICQLDNILYIGKSLIVHNNVAFKLKFYSKENLYTCTPLSHSYLSLSIGGWKYRHQC